VTVDISPLNPAPPPFLAVLLTFFTARAKRRCLKHLEWPIEKGKLISSYKSVFSFKGNHFLALIQALLF
jgi:hypothetical protein